MTFFVEKTVGRQGDSPRFDVVKDGEHATVKDNGTLIVEYELGGRVLAVYPAGSWTAAFADKQVHRRSSDKTYASYDSDVFGKPADSE